MPGGRRWICGWMLWQARLQCKLDIEPGSAYGWRSWPEDQGLLRGQSVASTKSPEGRLQAGLRLAQVMRITSVCKTLAKKLSGFLRWWATRAPKRWSARLQYTLFRRS